MSSELWTAKKSNTGERSEIQLTTDSTVPTNTSITVTLYEDVGQDGSGGSTDAIGNAYDNSASVVLSGGSETNTLTGFDGGSSTNDYWFRLEFDGDGSDPSLDAPQLNSIQIKTTIQQYFVASSTVDTSSVDGIANRIKASNSSLSDFSQCSSAVSRRHLPVTTTVETDIITSDSTWKSLVDSSLDIVPELSSVSVTTVNRRTQSSSILDKGTLSANLFADQIVSSFVRDTSSLDGLFDTAFLVDSILTDSSSVAAQFTNARYTFGSVDEVDVLTGTVGASRDAGGAVVETGGVTTTPQVTRRSVVTMSDTAVMTGVTTRSRRSSMTAKLHDSLTTVLQTGLTQSLAATDTDTFDSTSTRKRTVNSNVTSTSTVSTSVSITRSISSSTTSFDTTSTTTDAVSAPSLSAIDTGTVTSTGEMGSVVTTVVSDDGTITTAVSFSISDAPHIYNVDGLFKTTHEVEGNISGEKYT